MQSPVGMDSRSRQDRITGALLGTLVGDALGLPREGLGPKRALRMFGGAPLRHRLMWGRGVGSDDTEHACMTGQALLAQPEDPARFARNLAWRLRGWFVALPAGIGWATLRATMKLWVGFPPDRSGVVSAGNGPAMRAPILGACLAMDTERLDAFVRASTRLTHRDARAEDGARLVARAAAYGALHGPEGLQDTEHVLRRLLEATTTPDFREVLGTTVRAHLARGASCAELAQSMGLARGVTGFVMHTVPVALYAWLRHPDDFTRAVEEVILLGGDTDTVAAIAGGLVGATVGASGIPVHWLDGIAEWPRTVSWMSALAERLSRRFPTNESPSENIGPLALFWPGLLPRNLAVLAIVLAHGFRRLLPPY
ncbi:ADP-ribosylglycohydrolase family protein [Myxococcus sp. K38C18041901]|uniref:ADP-ribosylglycohydrolase family protein n=1 Tax=Myxococcus guangdongensis TaxID=2906760 RepID=UPI0020A826EB|nr:ADP-ribosylglycohydrolase family protein [Myxococcus guangdongensis]MCP3060478.1 ADP-ribosylglycohydrolase family protein [Myxococcus guangdongensis]